MTGHLTARARSAGAVAVETLAGRNSAACLSTTAEPRQRLNLVKAGCRASSLSRRKYRFDLVHQWIGQAGLAQFGDIAQHCFFPKIIIVGIKLLAAVGALLCLILRSSSLRIAPNFLPLTFPDS